MTRRRYAGYAARKVGTGVEPAATNTCRVDGRNNRHGKRSRVRGLCWSGMPVVIGTPHPSASHRGTRLPRAG